MASLLVHLVIGLHAVRGFPRFATHTAFEVDVWNPRPSGLCKRHCVVTGVFTTGITDMAYKNPKKDRPYKREYELQKARGEGPSARRTAEGSC